MHKLIAILFAALAVNAQAAGGKITPIENGKLTTDLNGNGKKIVGLASAQIGTRTVGQQFLDSLITAADTNSWEVGAHKAWLTSETDAVALAALSTNRPFAIYGTNQWIDGDGSVWRVSNVTNYTITMSGDLATVYGFPPSFYTSSFPFSYTNGNEVWSGYVDNIGLYWLHYGSWSGGYEAMGASSWIANPTGSWPLTLPPNGGESGTAIINRYTTVTTRVDTVAWQSDMYELEGRSNAWNWAVSAALYAYSPTNPPPATGVSSVNGSTGAVSVTTAGIGALTASETTNAIVALAQPKGPVVALWGTNGTEFATLEAGNVLTQWRVENSMTNGVILSGAGEPNVNGRYMISDAVPNHNPVYRMGASGVLRNEGDGWFVWMNNEPRYEFWDFAYPALPIGGATPPGPTWQYASWVFSISTNLVSTGLTSTALANLVAKSDFDSATNTLAAAAEEAYLKGALAQTSINSHSQNGTIGSTMHLLTGDRALIDSVPGKMSTQEAQEALASHASNTTFHATVAEKQAWNAKAELSVTNGLIRSSDITEIKVMTQAAYDALPVKDPTVLYHTTE